MTELKPIKGWKSLIERINEVIAGVNARTISVPTGGGIDIRETSSGTLIALSSSGVLTTADQSGILKVLATDPGAAGTGSDGTIEFIPWQPGAQTGWRKITFLEPVTVAGVTSNLLQDVWIWAGQPFNARACDANTWGGS